MVVTVRSLGLGGINGYEVSVECFLSGGLPAFDIVGLPDAAVKEARERVRAAVKNCGSKYPVSRITVNLAPAGRRKEGTVYDLPILLGILAASEEIPPLPADAAFVGELSLTGRLRPISGVLPMAMAAARAGIRQLYVPAENAAEATLAEGMTVYGVENVEQLVAYLRGQASLTPAPIWKPESAGQVGGPDFADVMGQENVKRALGNCRRRRPQRPTHWVSGVGKVYAGQTSALYPAGYDPDGKPADHGNLLRGGPYGGPASAHHPQAIPQPPPHGLGGVPHRRRRSAQTRGNLPGPQRRTVFG